MNWFFVALIAPILWAMCNHIDKHLLSKYFHNYGPSVLIVFSSLIGLFIVPFIFIFVPQVLTITGIEILVLVLSGTIFIASMWPYMKALQKDEASVAVPLFQMIPVFSFLFGLIFLDEHLSIRQILASSLIILGSVGITLDMSKKNKKFKYAVFFLMLVASIGFALNSLLFKIVAVDVNFAISAFWKYIGYIIPSILILLFSKKVRIEFVGIFKKYKLPIIGLNGINEILSSAADVSLSFATLLAPMTLVWVVNGFQPFLVFIYGVILTLFFPKFVKEDLSKKIIIQKILFIIIMFIGSYLLHLLAK